MNISPDEIKKILAEGFERIGCSDAEADAMSQSLVDAENAGVSSHGISMALEHAKKNCA